MKKKKEKIILELHYLLSNFDESKLKENKKVLARITNEISELLEINISNKTIKDFIQLKDSKFDENLLKLSKYLK